MRTIRIFLLATFVFPAFALCGPRMHYLTFGPMFHGNFGGGAWSFSKGLEISYWNYPLGSPISGGAIVGDGTTPQPGDGAGYSIDAGVEWEKKKTRLYCEPQIGFMIAGLSLGPVWEWTDGSQKPALGVQGSAWTNPMLAGVDLRGRWIGQGYFCPGFSAKLPLLLAPSSVPRQ